MKICRICGKRGDRISEFLGVCVDCIRDNSEDALKITYEAHKLSRERFGLTAGVPKVGDGGIRCGLCGNECEIPDGEYGFCGLVRNMDGRIFRDNELIASFYYDSLPTNCVASWCCAATGAGYPYHSHTKLIEYDYRNLAVFCIGCGFDCLFCQNWNFRLTKMRRTKIKDSKFLEAIDDSVSCICFFGGDPSPQLDKIIRLCNKANERNDRILRFCLETNGNSNSELLRRFAKLALESGGTIKFDLKFWNENLNKALTCVSNKKTLENFRMLSKLHKKRESVPFLVASTLLIPGYVDEIEIRGIASFIANIDSSIPYSLLAFYPHFEMSDMPFTMKNDAIKFKEIAENEGLENVRIGNIGILI